MKRLRKMNGKDAESYQRCRYHANESWTDQICRLHRAWFFWSWKAKHRPSWDLSNDGWYEESAWSEPLSIWGGSGFSSISFACKIEHNRFSECSKFPLRCSKWSPRFAASPLWKDLGGLHKLVWSYSVSCSQGSDNESRWGTAVHKTKSPVEWTNWLWMNYFGFMFFFAGLETASLHFPISPPYLQHALFGDEAISTSITRKVISCSGTFVQLSENGRQRCWPTVLGWACGIDEVGCLHRCRWILQYLGVWRNHLGTGKVPNSKTRWFFPIWTKLVFTRSQDPELIPPRLLVMLADNWSFQRCVKPSVLQVSSPATVEGGEVSSFVRCLSAKISASEAGWIARGFVSSSALQVLSDVRFECRLRRLSKPSPRIFDKPFHVQDMRSRLLVKSWSRGFEEWSCPYIVNPTAHILGKCRVPLLFLRKKPQYLVHNSATGWVQQNCLDC